MKNYFLNICYLLANSILEKR